MFDSANTIASYLAKFKLLMPPVRHVQGTVAEILSREFGITISPDTIAMNREILFVRAPAALKCELALHKGDILQKLNERLAPRSFSDIR